MGRFAPVSPARVRVQVLPVGKIERDRFTTVLRALRQHASSIRLGDVESAEQHALSPRTFPDGSLLFSYTTHTASDLDQQLSPFELFREVQLVLGIADGLEQDEEARSKELAGALEYLRESHPRVIHRHVLILPSAEAGAAANQQCVTRVAKSGDEEGGMALRDAMSEVSATFLSEFAVYAKATQASPSIQTPGQGLRGLQRASSLRSNDDRPGSGSATPAQSAIASPTDTDTSRPPSRSLRSPPPPTSFEQIQREAIDSTMLARSDSNRSKRSTRAQSQERASTQALSQAKAKDRGKARVGIAVAHVYLMAGQWNEALRQLTEHTATARRLSDNIWHAKGLEGIVVSMLLLAWAHSEFSVPSLCYAAAERSSAAHKYVSKLSVNLPSDFRPAEAAHQASVRRLAASLPDLLRQIISLYEAGEALVSLPPLVLPEARIRFCRLMATMYNSNNEISPAVLSSIVEGQIDGLGRRLTGSGPSTGLTRTGIALTLAEAQLSDDIPVAVVEQIVILTGMYEVYAELGMSRKKGAVLKDLIAKLTIALTQARKLGAADAGVHPSASWSTDLGADSVLSVASQHVSAAELVQRMCKIYGIQTTGPDDMQELGTSVTYFGNARMKFELLQSIMAFAEAATDPEGMLRATSALLKATMPSAAVDAQPGSVELLLGREEQIRLASTVKRTVAAARQLGLQDADGHFWDKFLVRGLTFAPQDVSRTLISSHSAQRSEAAQDGAANPLLYDPNSSRTATAVSAREVLVRNERRVCILILQNPLEAPLDIESIEILTESENELSLAAKAFHPATIPRLKLQHVLLDVLPSAVGNFSIVGCRIKIAGCKAATFDIYQEPWLKTAEDLVKHQGQDILADHATAPPHASPPKRAVIPVTSVIAMPFLELVEAPEGHHLVLMEGEMQSITVVVCNSSDVAAEIYGFQERLNVIRRRDGQAESSSVIRPGETVSLEMNAVGSSLASHVRLDLSYRPHPFSQQDAYARLLSLPFEVAIEPSLKFSLPRVQDRDAETFVMDFNVTNAASAPIAYAVRVREEQLVKDATLKPGDTERLSVLLRRPPQLLPIDEYGAQLQQELLRQVSVAWTAHFESGIRSGELVLSSLQPDLIPEDLQIICSPAAYFPITLSASENQLRVGDFATIEIVGQNRMEQSSPHVLVDLQPIPQDKHRIGFFGQRQRTLLPVDAGARWKMSLTVCPLYGGEITLRAVVRPVESTPQVQNRRFCAETTFKVKIIEEV